LQSDYCLSYLLTRLDFKGTLGFAYVGSVCRDYARVYDNKTGDVEMRSSNTGFVTVDVNDLVEAEHTFAHEIGHSLGASHDLPGSCPSPASRPNGRLMAPISPRDPGSALSRTLSLCSLEAIEATLKSMRRGFEDWCFVADKAVDGNNPDGENRPVWTRKEKDFDARDKSNNRAGGDKEEQEVMSIAVGFLIGAISLPLVLLAIGAILTAYAFIEQRFCFAPKDGLSANLVSTVKRGSKRVSEGARSLKVVTTNAMRQKVTHGAPSPSLTDQHRFKPQLLLGADGDGQRHMAKTPSARMAIATGPRQAEQKTTSGVADEWTASDKPPIPTPRKLLPRPKPPKTAKPASVKLLPALSAPAAAVEADQQSGGNVRNVLEELMRRQRPP